MSETGDQSMDEGRLAELAEEFAGRYRRGERPSVEAYALQHPGLAGRIRELFPALEVMESCVDATMNLAPAGERIGAVVGRYKLLERIGEGGFGTVFMAEQQHPVRRRVALKVLKPGVDTRQVIARFEAERQALALMEHENIAKVLDAGATDSGRPYFVMELVHGIPITDYCNLHHLPARQRLEIFIKVCRAVQHAHTKGLIHRDLKPTNVLVTLHDGVPVPKVIDFGVAKAKGLQLTDRTLFTQFAQMVGTPLYMSPEQAEMSGLDVDTRSDVYSLGVLLYELLTGTTPFDGERLRQAAHDEMRRIIREEEPPKPSTRISTLGDKLAAISAHFQTDGRRLGQLVRGDLDWIVMKCLEKDRTRRYGTAIGLGEDVERFLGDQPVQASSPGMAYRLRKFCRRNRRALITAGLLGAMAMGAAVSIGIVLQNRAGERAAAARLQASREEQAERAADAALQQAAVLRDRGDWTKAKAALEQAQWLLAGTAPDNPNSQRLRVLALDLQTVSRLEEYRINFDYGSDGLVTKAGLRLMRPQISMAFQEYGIDLDKQDVITAAGRIQGSAIRAPLEAALDEWLWLERQLVDQQTRWREMLTKNPEFQSQTEEKKAHSIAEQDVIDNRIVAKYDKLAGIANLLVTRDWMRDIHDRAVNKDRIKLEQLAGRHDVGELPPSKAILLARLLTKSESRLKAQELLSAVQAQAPADFGINFELASLLWTEDKGGPNLARIEEAIGYLRVAIALRPQFASLHDLLGRMLDDVKRDDQAIVAYRRAFELEPENYQSSIADALEKKGDWEGVSDVYRKLITLKSNESVWRMKLAQIYIHAGHWDKAIANYEEMAVNPTLAPAAHGYLAWILSTCPVVSMRDAPKALERARLAVRANGAEQRVLGVAYYAAGDWDRAIAALEEASKTAKQVDTPEWFFLAMAYWNRGDHPKALEWYRRASLRRPQMMVGFDFYGDTRELCIRFQAEASQLLGIKDPPLTPAERDLVQATVTAGNLLLAGDREGYQRLCVRLLEGSDQMSGNEVSKGLILARICLLAPDAINDTPLMERLPVPVLGLGAGPDHIQGMAGFRTGKYEEAIRRIRGSIGIEPGWKAQPLNWLVLAMAHHRLGHVDEARKWLDQATEAIDKDRRENPMSPTALGMRFTDWIEWQVLRREAESMIRDPGK